MDFIAKISVGELRNKVKRLMQHIERIPQSILVFGLALTVVICPLADKAVAFIPGIFGLFAFISYRFTNKNFPKLYLTAGFWIAFTLAVSALSIIYAYDPETSAERTIKLTAVFALLFVLLSISKEITFSSLPTDRSNPTDSDSVKDNLNRMMMIIPFSIIFCSLIVTSEVILGEPIYNFLHGFESIHYAAMNKPASFLVLMLFPSLSITYQSNLNKNIKLITYAVLTLSVITASMLSESQTSKLALIIGFLIFVIFPVKQKFFYYLCAAMFTLTVLATPFATQIIYDKYVDKIDDAPFIGNSGIIGQHGGFGAQRLEIYNFVSKKALDRPIHGHGIESARSIEFEPEGDYFKGDIMHPHNFAVQLWLEFGIIGAVMISAFASFLLYKISAFQNSGECNFIARAMIASFFATFCVASLGYNIWNGWWLGTLSLLFALYTVIIGSCKKSMAKNTVKKSIV